MKDIQQLIKKNNQEGRYNDIFPKTFLDAVRDRQTGITLTDILAGFNMYFLSYVGSSKDTRLQVPEFLRKTGLWITYVRYDKTIATEWYAGDDISDKAWGLDSNWRIGSNMLVGDITISSEGNWIVNGVDTGVKAQGEQGITPLLRIYDNKLQVSYTNGASYIDINNTPVYTQFREEGNKLQQSTDLGKTWVTISDYIAAWFRWVSEEHDTAGYQLGKIQISRDNGSSWTDLSGYFTNNLHIKDYVSAVGELPSSAALGDIYGVGPTYDTSDTEHTNPIYRLYVKTDSGWIDNGQFTSISAGVVQELGDSETEVISQVGVTKASFEYNVSAWNGGTTYTLADAINLVPTILRRLGQKVSFINSATNLAETWMYIGTDSNDWGVSNFVCSDAGFNGQLFDTVENPYNVDNVKQTGIYIKKNGTPFILFVKAEEEGIVKQIRLYVPDNTTKYVIGKRQYTQSTGSWSDWEQKEFATEDIAFDGFLETEDSEADNYIDKVTTTGIYRRKKSGYPVIYFIKTVSGITYQTQFYYNDSNELVFRVRHLNESVWTEWSNDIVTLGIRRFKFEDIDDIRSFGTYISSDTVNSGVLYVMRSSLLGCTFTQILFLNDTESGKLKKGIRHYDSEGLWYDWGWEEVGDTTLQGLIAKTGVSFNLGDYTQYHGYISQRNLTINTNENYRTISIPIEDIPDGQRFLTVPCQGGAILLVGYWKGDYNDSSNYLGRDSITAFSGAGAQMYTNVPLSNLIPEGTTHMTLCWSSAVGSPKLTIYNPDLNPSSGGSGNVSGTILPSTYLGQREVVYGGMNNVYLYKRGALLNIAGNHDDLIIVAGQSNADGRANKSEAPQWLIDMNYKIENYMMWNPIAEQFQSWELGVNTGSEDNASNQFGFDIYFAKKYLEANPTKKLYAIKQSVGGTPISPLRASGETRAYCWTPMPELITDGGTSMCNQLLEKIRKAYTYASSNNINLTPQALLWHQGEADMTEVRAPYFEDNLKGLLSWMRGIWAAPALPIINGQISSYYDTEWQPTYSANKAFATLNGIDSYFKTVNMEGQAMQPDNVHFAAGGYEHLGYGMWDYYLEFNPIYEPDTVATILSLREVEYKDTIPTD